MCESPHWRDAKDWMRCVIGRIGYVYAPGIVHFASGPIKQPKIECALPNDSVTHQAYLDQCHAMWMLVQTDDVQSRIEVQISRAASRLRIDEHRIRDVVYDATCRAALIYVLREAGDHRPFGPYAGAAVRHALKRLVHRYDTDANTVNSSELINIAATRTNNVGGSSILGQNLVDELQQIAKRANLTAKELHLLHSYYVDGKSLRDLVYDVGVSSPQTVLNIINRILERCRA